MHGFIYTWMIIPICIVSLFIMGWACTKETAPQTLSNEIIQFSSQMLLESLPYRIRSTHLESIYSGDLSQCITEGGMIYFSDNIENIAFMEKSTEARMITIQKILGHEYFLKRFYKERPEVSFDEGEFEMEWTDSDTQKLLSLWGYNSVEELYANHPSISDNLPESGTLYPIPSLCALDLKTMDPKSTWDYRLYYDWVGEISGCTETAQNEYPVFLQWRMQPDSDNDKEMDDQEAMQTSTTQVSCVEFNYRSQHPMHTGTATLLYDFMNQNVHYESEGDFSYEFGSPSNKVRVHVSIHETLHASTCDNNEEWDNCTVIEDHIDFTLPSSEFTELHTSQESTYFFPSEQFTHEYTSKISGQGGFLITEVSYTNDVDEHITSWSKEWYDDEGCVYQIEFANHPDEWGEEE